MPDRPLRSSDMECENIELGWDCSFPECECDEIDEFEFCDEIFLDMEDIEDAE